MRARSLPPPAIQVRSVAPAAIPPKEAPAAVLPAAKKSDLPQEPAAPALRPPPIVVTAAPETRPNPPVATGMTPSRTPFALSVTLDGITGQPNPPVPGRTMPIFTSRSAVPRQEPPVTRPVPEPELPPAEPAGRTGAPETRRLATPALAAVVEPRAPDARGMLGRSEVDVSQYFIYADQISANMLSRPPPAGAEPAGGNANQLKPAPDAAPSPVLPAHGASRKWLIAGAAALLACVALALAAFIAARLRRGAASEGDALPSESAATRIHPAIAMLDPQHPAVRWDIDTEAGSTVLIDDQLVSLSGAGNGSFTSDLTNDCTGPAASETTVEKTIAYVVSREGKELARGRARFSVPIVPLEVTIPTNLGQADRVSIAGRTARGANVTIQGASVAVTDGVFEAPVSVGSADIVVQASLPDHAPRIVHVKNGPSPANAPARATEH